MKDIAEDDLKELETQRDDLELELQSLLDNRRPNEARVNATRSDIDRINDQIALLRGQMTQAGNDGDALDELFAPYSAK